MLELSANLGFLWQELSLPDAIRAAKRAGFDAVECHWPYDYQAQSIKSTLDVTGLTMLSLNTIPGGDDEKGLAALPGRESDAREAIKQAVDYAAQINTPYVHVMAGVAQGGDAADTYKKNTEYACELAKQSNITILIEPINPVDMPGYFMQSLDQAIELIDSIQANNLKLMFDCYHVQLLHGNVSRLLESCLSHIGHIQIASVPDRAEPDVAGELDYRYLLKHIDRIGYRGAVGAEYNPLTTTDAGLSWIEQLRST